MSNKAHVCQVLLIDFVNKALLAKYELNTSDSVQQHQATLQRIVEVSVRLHTARDNAVIHNARPRSVK